MKVFKCCCKMLPRLAQPKVAQTFNLSKKYTICERAVNKGEPMQGQAEPNASQHVFPARLKAPQGTRRCVHLVCSQSQALRWPGPCYGGRGGGESCLQVLCWGARPQVLGRELMQATLTIILRGHCEGQNGENLEATAVPRGKRQLPRHGWWTGHRFFLPSPPCLHFTFLYPSNP